MLNFLFQHQMIKFYTFIQLNYIKIISPFIIMPELSAEKKLQQLKKILKIEKITSNTFVAEKIQLQTMIDLFCFDDILDKMLNCNYENSMNNNIDKILDNQISNYILIIKKCQLTYNINLMSYIAIVWILGLMLNHYR